MGSNNKENRQKGFISRLYEYIVRILLKPFFRVVANFFSHGATHFIFLFIIGASTFYLWRINNQDKITPHSLGVYVGYLSTYKKELREQNLSNRMIENVNEQKRCTSLDLRLQEQL